MQLYGGIVEKLLDLAISHKEIHFVVYHPLS